MIHFDNYPFIDISEVNRCLLCHDAPCTTSCCKQMPVGDILRSIYFSNGMGAINRMDGKTCATCEAPCEQACVLNQHTYPVSIKSILNHLTEGSLSQYEALTSTADMPDISTDICGVKLENPFMLSSSVVASNYEMIANAFRAGWAGVSFKTICNFPQHEASPRFSTISNHANAFCGFKNIEQLSDHSVDENMEVFRQLKAEFPNKVIVASIMGQNEEEWTTLARKCEEAGADVIECNFSCPNMENDKLGITIGQDATLIERFTRATRLGTNLPILAKMTPNITDMVPMAIAAKRGGADGIAAINTINSITGVDLESLVAKPEVHGYSMVGGYSGQAVKPIALRFISDLGHSDELADMHISGMGGIESWIDAVDFLAFIGVKAHSQLVFPAADDALPFPVDDFQAAAGLRQRTAVEAEILAQNQAAVPVEADNPGKVHRRADPPVDDLRAGRLRNRAVPDPEVFLPDGNDAL
jgi:dihydropyrimidine dehydrogenase (NAD+) subunit PreA